MEKANKNTTINHAYVNSGEYRKKFDKISDNIKLNRLLYQLVKQILNHRSGTLFEDMYWIDSNNLKIVAEETSALIEKEIVYSEVTKRLLQVAVI